jgi:glucose/arabinose dehydrogenase
VRRIDDKNSSYFLCLVSGFYSTGGRAPIEGKVPQKVEDRFLPEGDRVKVEVWVENLEIPWSLLFLPDDKALVSERPGRIRLIKGGKLRGDPYATLNVAHIGEGGLMGLALHPQFQKKPYLYAMVTYRKGSDLFNRVVRLKDLGDHGELDKVILDEIPGGRFHNGGRIRFGPDGLLYVTAGETFKAEMAQNLNSLGGKILRVTEEGGIPDDNPFNALPFTPTAIGILRVLHGTRKPEIFLNRSMDPPESFSALPTMRSMSSSRVVTSAGLRWWALQV